MRNGALHRWCPRFLISQTKKWSYCNLCKNFCTGKSWHDCNLFYLIFGECFAFFNEMFRTLFGNMIRMSITVQSSDWLQCFTFSEEMGLGSHNEGYLIWQWNRKVCFMLWKWKKGHVNFPWKKRYVILTSHVGVWLFSKSGKTKKWHTSQRHT